MALEGLQLGQYRLSRLLGGGGMGEVYLAEDARIEQQVAIKLSRIEATPYPNNDTVQDTVRLFQREAKAVARLDHPHILPLFSYGEELVNGLTLVYIVMPYRPEGSFTNWLQQRGNNAVLSVQDVAFFIGQCASALQYAHDSQIVHQDVKPSNFLIRTNKERPRLPDLLLADFGIARMSTATANVSRSIRGTPIYMAPEQWLGEPVYATDQYALAVMTYELLTGRPPFVGRQEQVMYQHLNVQPQPPSSLNLQLSRDVDAVLLRALAKRPEDRFPSISAFASTFQQAAQGLDASTLIKTPTPYPPANSDLHVTLAISKAEAQSGTTRTLTLPGGRRISVPVPAGAYNGQILRLPATGEPTQDGGLPGLLILTLSVQDTQIIAPPVQDISADRTVFSPNRSSEPPVTPPPIHAAETHFSQSAQPGQLAQSAQSVQPNRPIAGQSSQQRGVSTGTAILLIGIAFLLIMGGLGFYYLYGTNRPSSNTNTPTSGGGASNAGATSTAQAQSATVTAQSQNGTATAQANNATAIAQSGTATAIAQSNTPTSSYVQLKSSYSGTASGYADGAVTFTLQSEDSQGNVTMLTTFQLLSGTQNTDTYSCQGAVTTDRHINLQCSSISDSSYQLTVQGYVFSDGHMEGTETATNTNNSSYKHVYAWKAY